MVTLKVLDLTQTIPIFISSIFYAQGALNSFLVVLEHPVFEKSKRFKF